MQTRPRWARWLDALSLVLLIVSVAIALAPARVRLDLGFAIVSLGRAWRPLLFAIVVTTARHLIVPRPHLGDRVRDWVWALARADARLSARMLLTTRLPILLTGFVGTLVIGAPPTRGVQVSPDPLRDLPARWDATWYMEIARVGYSYDGRRGPDEQQSIVFFPMYPVLMRTLAAFTTPDRTPTMEYAEYLEMRQVHLVWNGLAIALAAFFGAMVVVYRWAELHAGAEAASGAVVLLSTYPFAVYFSAPYTESLYLLLASGACYAFERRRLPLAAAAGLLAGLTRPNGVMVSVALGILALAPLRRREPGWLGRTSAGLLVAAMPAVGLLVYCAFIYGLTGSPWTWMEAQGAWGRQRDLTASHYASMFRTIANEGVAAYVRAVPAEAVQLPAVLLAAAMVWPIWRRIGPAYALFVAANLLPPLIQGGVLSLGRFTATLFPVFLALALIIPPERRTSWIIAFAIGQGLIATAFFTWRPIY